MQIKTVRLENIRSYANQEINFPEGSVLLSGDIGSGKSTILLATEFALFGMRGKNLSGEALLRNGKNNGSVELRFEVDGKDVLIKRFLKRSKDAVGQTAGYIVIDDMKKELTAVELKSEILNLLGYPKELLTKSKNLVYRYTVYTPQEEMKQILEEDEEERLDTLRKVLGIDRYKRIRENCLIAIKDIKDKRRDIQASITDLDDKKKLKEERENEIKILDEKITDILPKIDLAKAKIKEKKDMIAKFEEIIKESLRLKKEFEIKEYSLTNKIEQRQRNNKNIEELKKQAESLRKEIEGKGFKSLKQEITEMQQSIIAEERKLREASDKISELRAIKMHSEQIKRKIINIDKCPTCEQKVSDDHKRLVVSREDEHVMKADHEMKEYSEKIAVSDEKIKKRKFELEELRKQDSEFSLIMLKKRNADEKEKQMLELIEMNEKLKKEIGEINIVKQELSKRISEYEGIDLKFKELKNELEEAEAEGRRIEIEKVKADTEKKSIERSIMLLNAEISKKEESRMKASYLAELQNWMEDGFLNLMVVMEKHVMTNIYSEFNELFQKWFSLIMEDETINVRLDERFTPLVEQNGYEVDISYLSGGERTSAALAYRLALNKVVNDMMSTIKTKDIIILDEPTDGFSSEQLDRVRDVLNEIGTKQTILVSHESKIESFVDHVIRIQKSEHTSEVSN
jgi:exonuclease SbcC